MRTAPPHSKTHPDPRSTPTSAGYLPLLRRYLAPRAGRAAWMAALLLLGIGLELLVPQLLRRFLDGATGSATGEAGAPLVPLALAFLAVAVVKQAFSAGATWLGADVGWTATNLLRRDLLAHVLRLDMGFHNGRTAGEMIERIDGDVTALSNFFSQFSVRVLGGILLLVGILVALWIESPAIGAALTVFATLELALLARARRFAVPASATEREAHARLFGFIEERLAGIDDLRANGGGPHALHRFRHAMRDFALGTRRAWMLRSVVWLSSYGLFVLGMAVALGAAIWLVRRGGMSVGAAYMVYQYMLMLQAPIEQITQQMQELQKAGAGVERIGALLAERSALTPRGDARLPDGPLRVELRGVDFAYDDRPVLEGVDLDLAPGTVTGLLGRTGSGKSTLVRLLLRFYDPSRGEVRIGGVDVRDLAPGELRRRVSMVTQEVQLFGASVRDNLTFFAGAGGAERADDARLEAVLRELGLGPWLDAQPGGLDAPIEANGANLSAGEAQLLALARAFLEDPGVVVLDEPSSRLDPATEERLERAVAKLLEGRTAIVIAHRLATVERADAIVVMGDGRVLERGPRAELAARPGGRYRALLEAARSLGGSDAALDEIAAPGATDLLAPAAPPQGAAPPAPREKEPA